MATVKEQKVLEEFTSSIRDALNVSERLGRLEATTDHQQETLVETAGAIKTLHGRINEVKDVVHTEVSSVKVILYKLMGAIAVIVPLAFFVVEKFF